MSRDASGTFTLNATYNPVVAGTAITVAWAQATLNDIGTEVTDSLNRSGKGAMLAGLAAYVGSVSLPGLTFSGDLDTGLYWIGANNPGMAVGGAKVQEWASTGSTIVLGLTVTNSQANGNGLSATATGTGIGLVGSGGSTTGSGGFFGGGTTSGVGLRIIVANAVSAPLRFDPGAQPSGPNSVGDMYMAAGGVLKTCTVAGTPGTWVSVGTQV